MESQLNVEEQLREIREAAQQPRNKSNREDRQVPITDSQQRSHLLDRKLSERYMGKIVEVKNFIRQLEPIYLKFDDGDSPQQQFDRVRENLFIPKAVPTEHPKKSHSEAKLTRDKIYSYNKWYIDPNKRFIKKPGQMQKIETDRYLQKILKGEQVLENKLNPFDQNRQPTHQKKRSMGRKEGIDPLVIQKAVKVIKKKEEDARVPIFFLPYLKKNT